MTKGKSKMDNPEKLTTSKRKKNKNTTQHVMDTSLRKQIMYPGTFHHHARGQKNNF